MLSWETPRTLGFSWQGVCKEVNLAAPPCNQQIMWIGGYMENISTYPTKSCLRQRHWQQLKSTTYTMNTSFRREKDRQIWAHANEKSGIQSVFYYPYEILTFKLFWSDLHIIWRLFIFLGRPVNNNTLYPHMDIFTITFLENGSVTTIIDMCRTIFIYLNYYYFRCWFVFVHSYF